MENKAFYHDDFYRDSKGNVYTQMYLENEGLLNRGHYERVKNPYEELPGVSVTCCYSQIFYNDSRLLLCNNIPSADPAIWDYIESGALEDEDENPVEIFQYFLIDESTAERLKEHTDEVILYSPALDLYILGVTHFGTSWGYVGTDFTY